MMKKLMLFSLSLFLLAGMMPASMALQETEEQSAETPVATTEAETEEVAETGSTEQAVTEETVEDDSDDQPAAVHQFDTGHTAWMLTCSALVLMMTAPGLALFYGGLVRKKNILSVMMQCIFLMGIMSIVWVGWGYSLAFDEDILGGFVGGLGKVCFAGALPYYDADLGQVIYPGTGDIPDALFATFQMMFFIITPALICGAFAERMKFSAMVVYSILWGTLVYCPIAHWVWSDNGWLCEWNDAAPFKALDFAGGTVVHISSGMSALVCALMIGRRFGYGQEPMPPHNLTYTFIGTALLWVGWFGFNAGSAVAANGFAVNAFLVTHLAASAGVVAWSIVEWCGTGKPTILGACSGAVAGLVCITPASGSVSAGSAILIGVAGGVGSYLACAKLKAALGYDDALDVFGVHGVSGILGALLTGVFATQNVTGGTNGLIEGNMPQMINQGVSILASMALAVIGSVILLKIIDLTIGLRVSHDEEIKGLDLCEHGEEGYIFL